MSDRRIVLNLQRVSEARKAHDETECTAGPGEPHQLLLSPFDLDRLDLVEGEEFLPGLVVTGWEHQQPGFFRIFCGDVRDQDDGELEEAEAIGVALGVPREAVPA